MRGLLEDLRKMVGKNIWVYIKIINNGRAGLVPKIISTNMLE